MTVPSTHTHPKSNSSDKALKNMPGNPALRETAEPHDVAVPVAETRREVAPRRSRAEPSGRRHGKKAGCPPPCLRVRTSCPEHVPGLRPHGVGQHCAVCIHLSPAHCLRRRSGGRCGETWHQNEGFWQLVCQQALGPKVVFGERLLQPVDRPNVDPVRGPERSLAAVDEHASHRFMEFPDRAQPCQHAGVIPRP